MCCVESVEGQTVNMCEHGRNTEWLFCPHKGHVIKILKAMYGRLNNHICPRGNSQVGFCYFALTWVVGKSSYLSYIPHTNPIIEIYTIYLYLEDYVKKLTPLWIWK